MTPSQRPPRSISWKRALEHEGLAVLVARSYAKRSSIPFEDLLQEARLTLFLCFDRGRYDPSKGKPSTYLRTAMWRHLSRLLFREARQPPASDEITAAPSREEEPTERIADLERDVLLHRALSRLSEYDRDLLTSLYGVGRPRVNLLQVARRTGKPRTTLYYRAKRAHLRLTKQLSGHRGGR